MRFFSNNNSNKMADYIKSENASYQVVIWSKSYCPYCRKTKQLFESQYPDIAVKIHELDQEANGAALQRALMQITGQRTVPNVFVNNRHVGGNDDVQAANRSGQLQAMLQATKTAKSNEESQQSNKESVSTTDAIKSLIEKENTSHEVVVWAKSWCPHCRASKDLLLRSPRLKGVDVAVHDIDLLPNGELIQEELHRLTGQRTVPNIFVKGSHLGGNSDLQQAFHSGALNEKLSQGSKNNV